MTLDIALGQTATQNQSQAQWHIADGGVMLGEKRKVNYTTCALTKVQVQIHCQKVLKTSFEKSSTSFKIQYSYNTVIIVSVHTFSGEYKLCEPGICREGRLCNIKVIINVKTSCSFSSVTETLVWCWMSEPVYERTHSLVGPFFSVLSDNSPTRSPQRGQSHHS